MTVDYPRAWQIVKDTDLADHHAECSYRTTDRTILCDCDVLMKHPEVTDDEMQGKQ